VVSKTINPSETSLLIPSCSSDCHIDVTATRLDYPGQVIVSTTYLPTAILDIYTDYAGREISQSLYTVPLSVPTPTLTWEYKGVTLTYPTVYAAYQTFHHIKVTSTTKVCVRSSATLILPSPTNYASLILPESAIPNPAFVPPVVVYYLNAQPTIIEQLGRSIGPGACDPIVGSPVTGDTSSLQPTTYVETHSSVGFTQTRHLAALEFQIAPTTVVQTNTASELSQGIFMSRKIASAASSLRLTTIVQTKTQSTAPNSTRPTSTINTMLSQSSSLDVISTPQSLDSSSQAQSTTSINNPQPPPMPMLPNYSLNTTTTSRATGTRAIFPTTSAPKEFPGAAGKANFRGVKKWIIGAAGVGLGCYE
jgi:hypothetical protein